MKGGVEERDKEDIAKNQRNDENDQSYENGKTGLTS